jgi:hypothetical protein
MLVSTKEKPQEKLSLISYRYLERTNSMTKLPPQPSSVTTFAKDFEYLIRRELDKVESEHGSTTLQRNSKYSFNSILE